MKLINDIIFGIFVGKARRLKQAKDEATEEIERYRNERDKQFKDFEAKVIRALFYQITHVFHTNSSLNPKRSSLAIFTAPKTFQKHT